MENNDQHLLIDAQDDFDRLFGQTRSLVMIIAANDHFESMSRDTLAHSLWLVTDQLERIEEAFQRVVKLTG